MFQAVLRNIFSEKQRITGGRKWRRELLKVSEKRVSAPLLNHLVRAMESSGITKEDLAGEHSSKKQCFLLCSAGLSGE